MDKKLLMPIGVLVVVVATAGIYFATRGGKVAEEKSEVTVTKQQTVETGNKETGTGCLAGTEKTVVGRKYQITGTETHTIQEKSLDLCCWEVGEEQQKKKICADSAISPVGYDNGILWETNKDTGKVYKAMERYQKDGKSCQQFYNVDGTEGPLNCQDRVN